MSRLHNETMLLQTPLFLPHYAKMFLGAFLFTNHL
jgi:hypothetical protein